jgi:hypothetical protein
VCTPPILLHALVVILKEVVVDLSKLEAVPLDAQGLKDGQLLAQ